MNTLAEGLGQRSERQMVMYIASIITVSLKTAELLSRRDSKGKLNLQIMLISITYPILTNTVSNIVTLSERQMETSQGLTAGKF